MGTIQLPEGLLGRISAATEEVRKHPEARLLSHYDADGISSAGILCAALLGEDIDFHVTLVRSLEKDTVSRIGSGGYPLIMLSDMGSGVLDALDQLEGSVIVLDHHKPDDDSERVFHLNPHLYGIDGMTSSSASAMCMLFAITLDERNWSSLSWAFAGIAGDRQDVEDLTGINLFLLEEGKKRGLLEIRRGSMLPGGPLGEGLEGSIEPYVVGVSGNRRGTERLLKLAGISPEERGDEIDEARRRKLSSLLALRLLRQGCSPGVFEELSRDQYYFPSEGREASQLASLLNACGRMDKEGVGLALTLGDEKALKEAEQLRTAYQREVLNALLEAKAALETMDHLQFFRNRNPSLSGVVCGISMQYFADPRRPTVALSPVGDKVKVSSRATRDLVEQGIDLSEALREAASAVGGVGGGHAVASGATVPLGKEEEFLTELNRIIGTQLSN